MNRIGFWWDIKTANIEYYDIQYAAERIISCYTAAYKNCGIQASKSHKYEK